VFLVRVFLVRAVLVGSVGATGPAGLPRDATGSIPGADLPGFVGTGSGYGPGMDRPTTAPGRPARLPSLVLGIGFGGFADGIVLHQILQWHHMLTNTGDHPATTVAGLETNTVADGLFHVGSLLAVVVGTVLAVRAWQDGRLAPSWRMHGGLLLVGWGVFNLVEGVINHHLLGIHRVRDDAADPLPWDLGFLAISLSLVVVGVLLARTGDPPVARRPAHHRRVAASDPAGVDLDPEAPRGARDGGERIRQRDVIRRP
jgi:uncharacterized membrane protein